MNNIANNFGIFVKYQRELQNISQNQLAEGLLDRSELQDLEQGAFYPDKLLSDRLLARLGESGYDYECFLQRGDYERWEERQRLLDALDNGELEPADQLLLRLEENTETHAALEKQFILVMRVQWLMLTEHGENCKKLLDEAIKLTVPQMEQKSVQELVLSVQELNLVLEHNRYLSLQEQEETCREIKAYLDMRPFDAESLALLYPKVAVYYAVLARQKLTECENAARRLALLEETIDVCRKALECLRNREKAYFAWELLNEYLFLLHELLQMRQLMKPEQTQKYEEERAQITEFLEFMERYYTRYGVPKQTNGFTCFYREHEVYCINQVIQSRRTMAELPRNELEVVCSRRTLQRLESSRETNGLQMANAKGLFDFFKLSEEMHRAQIITSRMDIIRLEKEFRDAMNQKSYTEAERLLQKLKENLSMKNAINAQYASYEEAFLAYKHQRISKEEFMERAITALECTVPYEQAMAEIKDVRLKNGRMRMGAKYLTNMEITILTNLANLTGSIPENPYWKVLREYFEYLEKKTTMAPILGMYGFVMTSAAHFMRDIGQYDEAGKTSEKILIASLKNKNFAYIERCIYGINFCKKIQDQLRIEDDLVWKKVIKDCFIVDTFCKDMYRANKRKRALEELN